MIPMVERFVSPGKGNGLRATSGISRGQLVISAEPLAFCVSNKQAREVCHHCFSRLHFPDPHPVHGVQLMRVGKLQHHLENTEDALDTFKQAFKIMKLTHGEDHPLSLDLQMKMEECRCEMAHQALGKH